VGQQQGTLLEHLASSSMHLCLSASTKLQTLGPHHAEELDVCSEVQKSWPPDELATS